VRPFEWSEVKRPFAAGVSEFPGAARDRAGACHARDVDQSPLSSDVTFWQRSHDRAAESCGRGIDQRASPVCAPDFAARIASEEYVIGENVEISGGRSRRTDVHEVVDGSGSGNDVNLLWIGRRSFWRTRGCPGCVRRDGKYSQTKTEDDSTPSDQQRFTHDYLPVAEQPIKTFTTVLLSYQYSFTMSQQRFHRLTLSASSLLLAGQQQVPRLVWHRVGPSPSSQDEVICSTAGSRRSAPGSKTAPPGPAQGSRSRNRCG
jgi:hypothetical protein